MLASMSRHLKSIAILLIVSLLTSVFLPYGSAFASKANPGEGMTKHDESNRPLITKPFPKNGAADRVEISTKRHAKQREFLNPDGTHTVEVYAQPIHWKNEKGKWEEIDNSIIPSTEKPDYGYENAANDIKIRFAKDLTNQAINRIQYKDHFVEFVPQNAKILSVSRMEKRLSILKSFLQLISSIRFYQPE